jgi:antitoxin component YwqK of YwqJK toxin-antitoxin module
VKKLIVLSALFLPLISLAQNDEPEDQVAAASDRLIEQSGPDDNFMLKAPYTGVAKDFYPSGQKKLEANFVNGKLEGSMMAWHENGQKEAEAYFVKGKREGPMTMWHANGQKRAVGNWINDKPDGPWTVWYDNGQREFVGTYQSGQIIMGSQWRDENGHTQFRSD